MQASLEFLNKSCDRLFPLACFETLRILSINEKVKESRLPLAWKPYHRKCWNIGCAILLFVPLLTLYLIILESLLHVHHLLIIHLFSVYSVIVIFELMRHWLVLISSSDFHL